MLYIIFTHYSSNKFHLDRLIKNINITKTFLNPNKIIILNDNSKYNIHKFINEHICEIVDIQKLYPQYITFAESLPFLYIIKNNINANFLILEDSMIPNKLTFNRIILDKYINQLDKEKAIAVCECNKIWNKDSMENIIYPIIQQFYDYIKLKKIYDDNEFIVVPGGMVLCNYDFALKIYNSGFFFF